MADQKQQCPKCNAPTEIGFVLDHGHSSSVFVGTWVEGASLPALTLKKMFSDPVGDRRQIPIQAFRCTSCGFLEFYAVAR